jgi:Flp pilus assembly protein TadD
VTNVDSKSRHAAARADLARGRPDLAVPVLRALSDAAPKDGDLLLDLGVALSQAGDQTAALVAFGKAATLKPQDPLVHANMGLAFERAGLMTEAETAMRVARSFAPGHAGIAFNLANVARKLGRNAEAEALYRDVIAAEPQSVPPRANLAALLMDDWRLVEARSLLRRAVDMAPQDPLAHFNLANADRMAGDVDAAIAGYEAALKLAPDWADAHFNLGFAALLAGDWHRGWAEFAWRWATPAQARFARQFDQPRWKGEAGDGKTLLLRAEQGLGDTLQFVRYAKRAQARGWRIVLEAQAALLPALARTPGIDAFVRQGETLPAFDAEAPLLDLPGIFGTTPDTVPADIPYVFADEMQVAAWRAKLGPATKKKRIGIVWGGNPDFPGDRWRSPGLKPLLPLFEIPDVEWVGLQVGPSRADLAGWTAPANFLDAGISLSDMGQSSALVNNLDAVVSSCTSVAHLAGAMGKPGFILLSSAPDWRWMLGRAETPWYPNLRLYRQHLAGDWAAPVAAVAAAIRDLR